MSNKPKFPKLEEQRVIYDVMKEMFLDVMDEPGGIHSLYAEEEAILFLGIAVRDEGFAPAPVEALSLAALYDARNIRAAGQLSPEDFI